jgi:hypothetical protein
MDELYKATVIPKLHLIDFGIGRKLNYVHFL